MQVEFYKGLSSEYSSETHGNSIYKETDTNNIHIFDSLISPNIIDISNLTIDLNDLLTDTQTLYYKYTSAGSANITNKPIEASTLLTVIPYSAYIKLEAVITVNTSDYRSIIYSRKYVNDEWTSWQVTPLYTDLIQNIYPNSSEAMSIKIKAASMVLTNSDTDTAVNYATGQTEYGNIFNTLPASVALHLTGAQSATLYQIVSTSSVGYWFADNKLTDYFPNGRFLSDPKTNKKAYITAYDADTKTITVNETLNPDEAWNDHTVRFGAFVSSGGTVLGYGAVANNVSIASSENLAGTSTAGCATALGDRCAALEDPIPYNNNMALEEGKYYSQDGVTYLCTRSTGQAVYNNLSDLVGIYVSLVE